MKGVINIVKYIKSKQGYKLRSALPDAIDDARELCYTINIKRTLNKPDPFQNNIKCVALFISGTKILSIGINKYKKTNPFGKIYIDNKKTDTHAEIDGLMKVLKMNTTNKITDIFCYRGLKTPLPSYPCIYCISLLRKYLPQRRLWVFDENKNLNIYLI